MADEDLATVLNRYVKRAGYSLTRIAKVTGIPRDTIVNWLRGTVSKPRNWRDLARLAGALQLGEAEATDLLRSAGHPSVGELLAKADDPQEREPLSPWIGAVQQGLAHPPFQAIADFPNFVGREHELEALRETLLSGHQVTLYSFQGMGGVGKTTLATHIAYELRPHFPDGVLWARVDTSDTMSILSTFADAYGRDVSTYTDVESRSRVVRGLLADKRALIVLDNVQSSEQAVPLLPPSGTCAVIVTTRRHDLSVTRAAHRCLITSFSQEKGEALDLFAKVLGQDVVESERATLAEIADLLGHLPLALDIAACRMAYEPDWSAPSFLERLKQEQRRLNELAYEDQNVRLSFNVSYEALSAEQQRFFAALGVFGGEDFDVEAAAYVTETPRQEAEDGLRALYSLSLVQRGRSGVSRRYRLHPLLRDYARERAQDDGVYERMVAYFACYTESHEEDHAALDLERDNIVAALEAAFEREMRPELVRGANAFYPFLEIRGLYALAEVHLGRAEQAIRATSDTPDPAAARDLAVMRDLAITLHKLGETAQHRGDYDRAEVVYREGLEAAYRSEYREGVKVILKGLGTIAYYRGDWTQARVFWQQGLALARESNDRRGEGIFLGNLGGTCYFLGPLETDGDCPGAIEYFEQALAIAREIGDHRSESANLGNLGNVFYVLGQTEKGIQYQEQALTLARQVGDRRNEGNWLGNLGAAYHSLGQLEADGDRPGAIEHYEQALAIAREIDDRRGEGVNLCNLGDACRALGRLKVDASYPSDRSSPGAVEYYEQALAIACEIGNRGHESECLNGLGLAHRDLKQTEQAITCFERARDVAHEIGSLQNEAEACWNLGLLYEENDPSRAAELMQVRVDYRREIGHADAEADAKRVQEPVERAVAADTSYKEKSRPA